jgi:predicted cupin superfamily sugar epimerase
MNADAIVARLKMQPHPEGGWCAETLSDWTFVGCMVSPRLDFSGFTLAPPNFGVP